MIMLGRNSTRKVCACISVGLAAMTAVPNIALACEGPGPTIVTTKPTNGLLWAKNEEGAQFLTVLDVFSNETLTITKQLTTDETDFKVPELNTFMPCLVGTTLNTGDFCIAEVKRVTKTAAAFKHYQLRVREGAGPAEVTIAQAELNGL